MSVALSGLHSAEVRLAASAHNVANLNTAEIRPLEVVQQEDSRGGSVALVDQAASPRPVELAHETVEQLRATHQYLASLRLMSVELDLRGQLTDVLA